jgi:hypothetical protein
MGKLSLDNPAKRTGHPRARQLEAVDQKKLVSRIPDARIITIALVERHPGWKGALA